MDSSRFAAMIREARKEKGLTQQELADRLHVTNKAVSKWERGISFPDISLILSISEILELSLYEMMGGERRTDSAIPAEQVDSVLSGTMREVGRKEKKRTAKWRLLFALQGGLLVLVIGIFIFWEQIIGGVNHLLQVKLGPLDKPWHSCEINVQYPCLTGMGYESFYIEQAPSPAEHFYPYQIMGMDGAGAATLLFILNQEGMQLDHAPKLKWDERYLYVLFDGLDNEDYEERLYGDAVGADPQGFLPHLYRYDRMNGMVEEIVLHKPDNSLLLDVFTYNGETVYLEARFKGLPGGLNLGYYLPDGIYFSNGAEFNVNLVGSGGLQTCGILEGSSYYVCGQDGVYCYDLEAESFEKTAEMDFSKCLTLQLSVQASESGQEMRAVYTEISDPDTVREVVL